MCVYRLKEEKGLTFIYMKLSETMCFILEEREGKVASNGRRSE